MLFCTKILNLSKMPVNDLDNLIEWEQAWSMEFHPQKCKVFRVTNKKKIVPSIYMIHGIELELVKKAKYRGVAQNEKLNLKDHRYL